MNIKALLITSVMVAFFIWFFCVLIKKLEKNKKRKMLLECKIIAEVIVLGFPIYETIVKSSTFKDFDAAVFVLALFSLIWDINEHMDRYNEKNNL